MKKNGFTLAELLGVITILSLILLIAIPTIDRMLKEGKTDLYASQIKSIEAAAKMWGTDHINELPDVNETKTITLSRLWQDGYMDENIENPKTKKPFSGNLEIKIVNHGTYYRYQVIK